MMALEPFTSFAKSKDNGVAGENMMTYRTQQGTGEKISLLGFGMMRLPRDNQELVNQLVDYAIAHGVNYFDRQRTVPPPSQQVLCSHQDV